MLLSSIISIIESVAPLAYQESYDNSGLVVGDRNMEISGITVCLDVTLEVIDEAVRRKANLIVSHHPVIFNPLKKLTENTLTEKILISAVRNNIALYSAHTNLDNVVKGVNQVICDILGLTRTKILTPRENLLKKLVTFVPRSHADSVRKALFDAGAGHIGNYDSCSFSSEGKGTFRAGEDSSPYVGEIGELHVEDELRIETIFPFHLKPRIVRALLEAHPYEEVAYDIVPVENSFDQTGSGMVGELDQPMEERAFLNKIKTVFNCKILRHSRLLNQSLSKVAVCGGSGSFLIKDAITAGAQLFLTGEIKYHQFFEAEDKIVIADIGHFESEQFTIQLIYDILIKNLPNFAIHFSSINTSPIYYL
ncbi:MAG TPA: Nif3-like dinuclear metal center hexameric protein [Bacteroidales bacterium]|jgi:dinuclear metal center YbgI/SA1388 family protein|nr:Nif3-like dinuclear metal center hexameric protein [Bacteroidales bacterium]